VVFLEDAEYYAYFIKDKVIKNFTILSVVVFFIFGSIYITNGNTLLGALELFFGLLLILNLYGYNIHDNQKIASLILLFSIYIMSLVIYVTGGIGNTGYLWLLFIPIFTFVLLEDKIAKVSLIGYVLVLFFLETLHYIDVWNSPYSMAEVRQTFLVFGIFIYIIYFNEMLKMGVKKVLAKKNAELKRLSTMDHLTNIYNRSYIFELVKIEMQRSKRNKKPMSLIFFDIDNFKNINDTYGHSRGDELLKRSCELFKNITRKVDTIGRWGGEEFIIVCSETDLDSAKDLCERLRYELSMHKFSFDEEITASFGVVQYNFTYSIDELIEKADNCMYEAKKSGKNKVIAYESL
jgi:diguanylate cyclase (GGDEF)-like protein